MTDLVGTCPKVRWHSWINEGDAAGSPPSPNLYGWFTSHWLAYKGCPGDRFYVVAHGKLRGWAPIVRVEHSSGWCIVRGAGAVACTLAVPVRGFQGLRTRWWAREDELPFPDWRQP